MTKHESTMADDLGGVRPHRLQPLLLVGALHLALSGLAQAGEDGLLIRSGRAELRSASPREAGKVPVVFVHGMLSSPENWSLLIDRLSAEPPLRERFQFLTFRYDSLQAIPESGRELLDALTEARRRTDPDGRDRSFDQVVLVGHSLGGLVAKAAVARARETQYAEAAVPRVGGQGKPATPRIARIIFIATPHRGVPVDGGVVHLVGARIARAVSQSVVARQAAGDANATCFPTSVDQLTWNNPLLGDLERASAAARVPTHSIIAALCDPSLEGATDGLVPVASSRLPGAQSEVVIQSPHVCYQRSEVIREVHRILCEHAAEPSVPPSPESVGSSSSGQD